MGSATGSAITRNFTVSLDVAPPLIEQAAEGSSALDTPQRAAIIGDVVPIVFCRRVAGVGGVLVSPPATEARFEDDASSNITASYHLVLSEGQIGSIETRDVFQRSCRVGSYSQTYGRRAGTFIPGNFIDNTPNLEAPTYCGTGGTYANMSTIAFSVTIPAGFDYWNRQIHCFIRGGIYVPRLLDGVTGPSNNIADLLRYLLRSSSRVPEAQIDTASLLVAARFAEANGFWFNGKIDQSANLRDWMAATLPYFMLRQSRIGGKEGLRLLLPANADGTIKTTAVDWKFVFTEKHVVPGSFEIAYTPLADRKPFCVMVLWRQQDDLGIPLMRTTEVRYVGTAVDGPFEQHDLSGFCASEDHAVKAGTYILSKRRHVTHQLRISVKPDAFNATLAAGDRVRVVLTRVASTGANSVHDYLYEVDSITKSTTGRIGLELTHFPIDNTFASVVAKEVDAAVGAGLVLPTGLTGVTCDVNSSGDTTIPPDTGLDPGDWNLPDPGDFSPPIDPLDPIDPGSIPDVDINDLVNGGTGGLGGGGLGGGGLDVGDLDGGGDAAADNPEDGLGDQGDIPSAPDPFADYPKPGDANYPPNAPEGLVPILMAGGIPAPGGPIPDTWEPGSYNCIITKESGFAYVWYQPSASGACEGPNTIVIKGGSLVKSGFFYGLYKKTTPGICGGDSSFSWWTIRARSGFNPVWYGLGGGGRPSGVDHPTSWSFENIFVPV
jgi:hypothetical protein